jgi:hypothetical protein
MSGFVWSLWINVIVASQVINILCKYSIASSLRMRIVKTTNHSRKNELRSYSNNGEAWPFYCVRQHGLIQSPNRDNTKHISEVVHQFKDNTRSLKIKFFCVGIRSNDYAKIRKVVSYFWLILPRKVVISTWFQRNHGF